MWHNNCTKLNYNKMIVSKHVKNTGYDLKKTSQKNNNNGCLLSASISLLLFLQFLFDTTNGTFNRFVFNV